MKFINPIILFLDNDPVKSASYLTNVHLEQGIKNSCQILLCSIYYMLGFRTKTIFKYYFCKERWEETRFKYFSNYPLKTIPKYSFYNSQESRWCRKCHDHYKYVVNYFESMLNEYAFRFNSDHPLYEMYDFLRILPMEMGVRYGFKFPKLKNKNQFQLPWKNLPLKYRRKDIILGYREYYKSTILSPDAFIGTKRDVPDFILDKFNWL